MHMIIRVLVQAKDATEAESLAEQVAQTLTDDEDGVFDYYTMPKEMESDPVLPAKTSSKAGKKLIDDGWKATAPIENTYTYLYTQKAAAIYTQKALDEALASSNWVVPIDVRL